MTKILSTSKIIQTLKQELPGLEISGNESWVTVNANQINKVSRILKNSDGLDFSYLNAITAVDYIEYFQIIYHLTSMRNNYSCVIKVRCDGRTNLELPSVIDVWKGADLQEREIWDLMGIKFSGHPNLKRILLWEGFDGHPLRKDYLG